MAISPVLLHFHEHEQPYLPRVKKVLAGRVPVKLSMKSPTGFYDILLEARQKGCTRVATTSDRLLSFLLATKPGNSKKLPSVSDYAGSIIERAGMEFLVLNPLEQLVTVPHGQFIADRYWKKFYDPSHWVQLPEFQWELFEPSRFQTLLDLFTTATFISIDIETIRGDENRAISCCGFTAVWIDPVRNTLQAHTVVIPLEDMFNIVACRAFCGTPCPKVLQHGLYDIAYLLRYGIHIINYLFDTLSLFHSWYSELPKDLGFIVAFLLRKWEYWKDESSTGDRMQYYGYNAKDCFTTAMSLVALLAEMPPWAIENEKMKFPVMFPSILASMTGIKCDLETMADLNKQVVAESEKELARLQIMVGNKDYNPNSSQQTVKLFAALGSEDIKSSDEKHRDKVMARHPLNKRILTSIDKYREKRKLLTSCTRNEHPKTGKKKVWLGRIYYEINPSGTDTGRNASTESQYWCGLQIQNIPRDLTDIQIKQMFVSDPGFYLGEADGEQAEARDTAYLSGDLKLIETVEGARDYHGVNAERFFGVPYEKIIGPDGKPLDKTLRDLSKRTNHGSNYNMGAGVLLDTMGIENVLKARKVLRLPNGRTLEQAGASLKATCQFMLDCYAQAYPTVKGAWYDKVKRDVSTTSMLVGPTGWTRFCFGKPDVNKRDLNRYVAHPPQSLNAMVLNQAFVRVFIEVWLPNQRDFKLLAQIHDSIFFQYRVGRRDLAVAVKRCMEIVVPVRDAKGTTRDLLVPVALKGEATRWSELKDQKKWTKEPELV